METWLVERYVHDRLKLPGGFFQAVLNAYFSAYHWVGILRGGGQPTNGSRTDPIAPQSNTLMAQHYDLPLELFERMLGPSMKYSMALWETGARTLEEAQEAMLADVCAKAEVRDGDSVLDIGCGFGSLCQYILRKYPTARVVGLTLSRTQADYIRRAQEQPGHPFNSPRFQLVQEDFNTVTFDRPFDRILSLGVFEHVANFDRALEKVRSFLRSDGRVFLHYIVFRRPLHRLPDRAAQSNFMDRYVFPGGRVWFDEELASHGVHLQIARQWYMNGQNYRRTIEMWLKRFLAHRNAIAAEAHLDARRLNAWELYLRCCIGIFQTHGGHFYGNGQYLMVPRLP